MLLVLAVAKNIVHFSIEVGTSTHFDRSPIVLRRVFHFYSGLAQSDHLYRYRVQFSAILQFLKIVFYYVTVVGHALYN